MMRQGSVDETNMNQYSKISNYEDTVRQLDIYYGIGMNFTLIQYIKNLLNIFTLKILF